MVIRRNSKSLLWQVRVILSEGDIAAPPLNAPNHQIIRQQKGILFSDGDVYRVRSLLLSAYSQGKVLNSTVWPTGSRIMITDLTFGVTGVTIPL